MRLPCCCSVFLLRKFHDTRSTFVWLVSQPSHAIKAGFNLSQHIEWSLSVLFPLVAFLEDPSTDSLSIHIESKLNNKEWLGITNNLPDWLKQCFQWHKEQRAKLTKETFWEPNVVVWPTNSVVPHLGWITSSLQHITFAFESKQSLFVGPHNAKNIWGNFVCWADPFLIDWIISASVGLVSFTCLLLGN